VRVVVNYYHNMQCLDIGKAFEDGGTIMAPLAPKHTVKLRVFTLVSIVLAVGVIPACNARNSTTLIAH